MKKLLFLAVVGAAAATLTLATPAVSLAGWHGGRGYHRSYHRGYSHWHHYRGYRYYNAYPCWFTAPDYCAPVAPTCNPAHIRMVVPANAKVWINDQETQQCGVRRYFDSPPLEAGKEFSYTVTARWCGADGKDVVQTRQVDVQANACVDVDFLRTAS
jgi:uncharacterized protein (TIGR03000 family)